MDTLRLPLWGHTVHDKILETYVEVEISLVSVFTYLLRLFYRYVEGLKLYILDSRGGPYRGLRPQSWSDLRLVLLMTLLRKHRRLW